MTCLPNIHHTSLIPVAFWSPAPLRRSSPVLSGGNRGTWRGRPNAGTRASRPWCPRTAGDMDGSNGESLGNRVWKGVEFYLGGLGDLTARFYKCLKVGYTNVASASETICDYLRLWRLKSLERLQQTFRIHKSRWKCLWPRGHQFASPRAMDAAPRGWQVFRRTANGESSLCMQKSFVVLTQKHSD